MKKLLRDDVIPKCEAAESKKEFKSFSSEFTIKARNRTSLAGIKGEEREGIVNAFIERSLGVVYDVHKQIMEKSSFTPSERKRIRETLIFNGRTKRTVNKILLADAYVDMYVSSQPTHDSFDRKAVTKQKKNSMDSANASMQDKTLVVEKPHAIHSQRKVSVEDTPATQTTSKDEPDDLAVENRQLKSTIQSLQYQLDAVKLNNTTLKSTILTMKLEASANITALDSAEQKLHAAEKEVVAAKTAQQAAEDRMNDQADVLSQTLSLLGGATAKISKLKSEKNTPPPSQANKRNSWTRFQAPA